MSNRASSPDIDRALYDEMVELAQPHIEQANGLLSVLDYDPEKYLAQQHDRYVVPGELAPIEVLDLIGKTVLRGLGSKDMEKGFEEISEDLMTDDRRQAARATLRNGKSLYVATSHSNLIDPAIGLGAVINPLLRERDEADDFQTGIIINKMLAVLQYQVGEQWMPCMQVLQLLCDRTYLSFPQSETFRNSAAGEVLPEGHIKAHNGEIKEDVKSWLGKGGAVLGVAPTGSTHKWNQAGTKSTLPKVTHGTGEMMAEEHIRVLPLIMDLDADQPFIEAASDGLYHVKRWQGAHRIPQDMANAFSRRSANQGSSVTYDYQGRRRLTGLPLIRRRYIVQQAAVPATA